MKRGRIFPALLGLLFAAAFVLAGLRPPSDLPYSSYSASPEGTKAAYLLLEELGFQVGRKTRPERQRGQEGSVVLALGPAYLPGAGDALVLPEEERFLNSAVRDNAEAFVALLWPYRDKLILFDEYGRSAVPLSPAGENAATLDGMAPLWLKGLLGHAALILLAGMLFYRQRLGEPALPEGFAGRQPLEGVEAMAGAMRKAKIYAQSARYYYRYHTRGGARWDTGDELADGLEKIRNERDALRLVAEIDRRINERT